MPETPELPSTALPASESGPGSAKVARGSRRRWLRAILLILGPAVVLAGAAYVYVTGQRVVSTDNAYLKSDKVALSAQISGPIVDVAVAENQAVTKGDVLFRLDAKPFQVALEQAKAKLAGVRQNIVVLKTDYRQKQEELRLADENLAYAEVVFRRQSELTRQKVASEAKFDEAKHAVDVARQQISVLRQQEAATLAQLGGNPNIAVEDHPDFRAAQAALDQAALDLEHATVTAPFAGIASKKPEVGQYVQAGTPVMSIVAAKGTWIEANFKETDLTHVKLGQPVAITVDTYPDRRWQGTVESISQATGAEFSVLPAQNATGNWVKVVQRIPVRIAIKSSGEGDDILRAGMSAVVDIDTGYSPPLPTFVRGPLTWLAAVVNIAPAKAGN
ncbi:MAG: HlyD family secretion protein [Rhodospirillales bacterium]|jgi:membrane fusion protein (multidrug efflux system)